jgi:hypothetical protein
MASYTWIGDDDPAAQVISMLGYQFVKGEPVTVDKADEAKFKDHPLFTAGKAEVTPANEPEPADPETGSEKAALKDEIERLTGKRPQGNPSVDTLRGNLAKLVAKD